MVQDTLKIQGALKVQGDLHLGTGRFGPIIPFTWEITNWVANIKAAGLPTPSYYNLQTTNLFLLSLSGANIRNKIKRLNLFNGGDGGDWRASFFPIINDIGNTYDYCGSATNIAQFGTTSFRSTDWSLTSGFNAQGAYPAGNTRAQVSGGIADTYTKWIDTTVAINNPVFSSDSVNPLYNIHMSVYTTAYGTGNGQVTDIGATAGTPTPFFTALQSAYSSTFPSNQLFGASRWNSYQQDTNSLAGGSLISSRYISPVGFFVGSRLNQSYSTIYKDGSIITGFGGGSINPDTNFATSATLNNDTIVVFGRGNHTTSGARKINDFNDRCIGMYSIGLGLTDTDAANFNNIVTAFNTAIGRPIY